MTEIGREPEPVLPFLRRFYEFVIPLSWPVVRIACGMHLVIHGWGKILRGGTVSNSTIAFGIFLTFIEFFGGICISIGLFTRFFAAAAAVEMLIITILYWKAGFSWLNRGYEYTLLWGLVCFAIALRGGGPYSVDRRIGVEL